MKGPPLGPCGEDITWPDQVAPWSQRTPSTRKIKPQTSNLAGPGTALSGPTFAAPRAACGSSAATTVHGRGLGLGRRCGWWGHRDWWRWWARGSPHSPVPWGCVGSGGVGVRGLVGTRAQSPLQCWVEIRCGGSSGASAGCGLTSGVGRGEGTLLVGPGAALVWSGVVRGPGVWALRGGETWCVLPRPRGPLP